MGNKEVKILNRIHVVPRLKTLHLQTQLVNPLSGLAQDLVSAPGDPLKEFRLWSSQADEVVASVQARTQDHWPALKCGEGCSQVAQGQGGQIRPYQDGRFVAARKQIVEPIVHSAAQIAIALGHEFDGLLDYVSQNLRRFPGRIDYDDSTATHSSRHINRIQ